MDMPRTRLRALVLTVILLTTCAAALLYATAEVVRFYGTALRGVSYGPVPGLALPAGSLYGVNARLHEESPELAPRLLDLARQEGFGWLRQEFPWGQIEPRPGLYEWEAWDRVVEMAGQRGLRLIAVVDTSPAWARGNALGTSPPDDTTAYSRFAGVLAARYRGRIAAYQVWDEPNIAPHWGSRYASAIEYTAMLKAAYQAIKASDPEAVVLGAGLAPTTEESERNQSDVAFLQGMYRAGAGGFFDALAAKPYGFWTGPDDRRVDPMVLNFSRVILLREIMERNGDAAKPVWAVEMGWNALPPGWQGRPAPWGSDSPQRQAQRTTSALARARSEWPWLAVMVLPALRYPTAAPDDPVRGFALLNDDLSPRPVFSVLKDNEMTAQMRSHEELRNEFSQFVAMLILLASGLALVGWLLVRAALCLPWEDGIAVFLAWPETTQAAVLAGAVLVFYWAPWSVLALALLPVLLLLVLLRPDLGLLAAVAAIPFAQQPRRLVGSWEFSLLEVLTVVCAAAWALRSVCQRLRAGGDNGSTDWFKDAPGETARRLWVGLHGPDRAALFLLLLGVLSLAAADGLRPEAMRLAVRELRVVIVEPVLLYFLITRSEARRRPALAPRLALALVAGGVLAAALGLYQYVFTSQVITAEAGLRRMLGPYPSPNALGLLLERVVPLALSLAVAAWVGVSDGGTGQGQRGDQDDKRERWAMRLGWAAAVALLGAALVLTFSVGAWAAAGVGCFVVVLRQRRRVAATLLALGILVAVAALPLLQTERVASHFNLQSATTSAVRVAVWQSAADMIRDHPITGVGLDGFLELYRTQYIRPEAWREPDLSHPHNLVLEAWISLGLLGPVAYLWLLASALYLAHRVHYSGESLPAGRVLSLGLAGSLVAGAAHGLVDRYLAGAPDLAAALFVTVAILVLLNATPQGSPTLASQKWS